MDDSKRGLNLVGTTVANIKNELLSLAGIIQNQLIPGSNQFAVSMQAATANFAGTRGGPTATNVIANNGAPGTPRDTSGIQAGGNNNNIIGSRALTGAAAFGGGAMAFGGFISSVMPSAATAVRQDLLTAQSAFYGQGGFGGSLQQQSANVRALQNALARRGTAINAMDTTNALAMAQSLGLSGASNFNQVMTGIATASNFAPGIGLAGGNGVPGAVQVMGTMNAPATVNMLKTVGINVRGPNGEIMPLPQIVERLWGLITQNGRIPISEADIQTSLIPGNGLYGMLISLYGNDQMTFTLVSNMLLAKARSGGKALASMSKAQLQSMGLTTATVNKMANQTAAQTGLLTATASATAAGYGLSADLGAALNNFATAAGPLTQALGSFAGGYSGTMGLGNSAMGGAIKTGLASLAGANIGKAGGPWGAGIGAILGALFLGREKGGPTDSNTPYIVGEKGPELFIPKTDGVVIPNGIFRQSGGGQRSTGALSNTELRNILEGAGFAGDALTNAMAVARAESGGRPGALNPTVSTGDYSMGLFQVNMIGDLGKRRNAQYLKDYAGIGYTGPESLYDPAINAAIAYDISKGGTKWSNAWVNTSRKLGLTDSGSVASLRSAPSSGSATTSVTSSLSPAAYNTDYYSRIQGLISSTASSIGLSSAGGGNTYNNGPLTINISGSGDPKTVAKEVEKILKSNNLIATTGGH